MKEIPKNLWQDSWDKWYPGNPKRGDLPDCGYCDHDQCIETGESCDNCSICDAIGICSDDDSIWSKWDHASNHNQQTAEKESADLIFNAIVEDGIRLGYVPETARKVTG